MFVSKKIFLTKGVGRHREKLNSFEMALRDAGIAPFNLVRVSSIFAPRCKIVSQKAGLNFLRAGQIVPVVMSENATNEPSRLVAASIGRNDSATRDQARTVRSVACSRRARTSSTMAAISSEVDGDPTDPPQRPRTMSCPLRARRMKSGGRPSSRPSLAADAIRSNFSGELGMTYASRFAAFAKRSNR